MTNDTDHDCDWVLNVRGGFGLEGHYRNLKRPVPSQVKVYPCVLSLGHTGHHEFAKEPLTPEEVA